MSIYAIKVTCGNGAVITWDDHFIAENPMDAIKQACHQYPYSHDHVYYMEATSNPKEFRLTWAQERDMKNVLRDWDIERCD
jgi:hypothetical protein